MPALAIAGSASAAPLLGRGSDGGAACLPCVVVSSTIVEAECADECNRWRPSGGRRLDTSARTGGLVEREAAAFEFGQWSHPCSNQHGVARHQHDLLFSSRCLLVRYRLNAALLLPLRLIERSQLNPTPARYRRRSAHALVAYRALVPCHIRLSVLCLRTTVELLLLTRRAHASHNNGSLIRSSAACAWTGVALHAYVLAFGPCIRSC